MTDLEDKKLQVHTFCIYFVLASHIRSKDLAPSVDTDVASHCPINQKKKMAPN